MKKLLIALLLAAVSGQAFGWGSTAHRVTGEIAEAWLSPEAHLAVRDILGVETLAEASTWPDFMRAHPSEFWQRTASPFHYVTVPEGKTYAEVGAPEQGDAFTALEKFSADLRDPETSAEDRALALRFIVHIIGDLHQPLHAGNGTDRGGNDVRVSWFGEATNLHRVWDSHIVDHEQLSYTEWTDWLMARIGPDEFRAWNNPDPKVWIAESAALRDRIYPEEDNANLRWDYAFEWMDTVRLRMSQGGVRIAAYLNALFAED